MKIKPVEPVYGLKKDPPSKSEAFAKIMGDVQHEKRHSASTKEDLLPPKAPSLYDPVNQVERDTRAMFQRLQLDSVNRGWGNSDYADPRNASRHIPRLEGRESSGDGETCDGSTES